MGWTIADKKDSDKIIKKLMEHEWLNIQALSQFYTSGRFTYPRTSSVITLVNNIDSKLDGIVVITSKGLIYPGFSQKTRESSSEKHELIKLIGQIRVKVHGVLGLKEDVDFFDKILFNRIRGVNNYYILYREKVRTEAVDDKLSIFKAEPKDLNSIIPLEFEYQKEEVLLNPSDLNKRAIKLNFRNKLKNDDIYIIKNRGIIVTKAGTTYRSPGYVLIGGVFTWKEFRNNGYGYQILKYLINDQLSKSYKCALFVKQDNKAALHLYKKLGFIEPRPYKINYYYN